MVQKKKTISGKIKRILFLAFCCFLMVAECLSWVLGVQSLIFMLRKAIFVPEQYYFWQDHAIWGNACAWITLLTGFLLILPIFQYMCSYKEIGQSFLQYMKDQFLIRHWKSALAIALILMYLSASNVIYAGKDAIYAASTFHPAGTAIPCDEIEKIEVGYCAEKTDRPMFYLGHEKGDFYYKIMIDGEWITFDCINHNEDRKNSEKDYTLLGPEYALADFDETLVSLGIPKTVNRDSLQYEENLSANEKIKVVYRSIIKNGTE